MDELQFDSLFQQPFGRPDVIQADGRLRRCIALGIKLWGTTSNDLRRQLLTSYPDFFCDHFRWYSRLQGKRRPDRNIEPV